MNEFINSGAFKHSHAKYCMTELRKEAQRYREQKIPHEVLVEIPDLIPPLADDVDFQLGDFDPLGTTFYVSIEKKKAGDIRAAVNNLIGMLAWQKQHGVFNVGYFEHPEGLTVISVNKPENQANA